ncbi:MAG: molybdopterin-dependent oxidoreductase [Polyangiaceae bacterium]
MRTETTFCRICEALCGLEVDVEEDRVVDVRPDSAHVATGGFACVKGLKQHRIYGSPDRLAYPERRRGSKWERISWDEALAEIGERTRKIRDERGADAIAMYVGTAAGFSVLHPIFAQGFMTGLGSKSMYSSATQDCANKFAVSRELYGFPFTLPFPDVERTRCLIVVGANPVVSKWSFLQVPNPTRHLREIVARGGKVWVVDPRRTETAKAAGEYVAIRPNTDVFFYLSFLNEMLRLVDSGRFQLDRARLAKHTTGFERIAALVRPWPKERTAPVTRIPPETLHQMVVDYLSADGAALYCSTGVNMGENGSICYWLQEVANAVSGNLDRAGGTLVGRGIVDFPAFGRRTGTLLRTARSRVGSLPSVNDAFAGGVLADEILTPGAGQVRALFVTGGNPLITMPNSARLARAFEDLELLVTLDIHRTETGSLAHFNLPATSPFERPDLPFLFPLLLGLQARPYLQATRAVARPTGEQRDEASIYLDLCRAAGVSLFGSRVAQTLLSAAKRAAGGALPQEALLSLILSVTGFGSFPGLLRHPHGKLRPDHAAADFLGRRVYTEDGKVHLAPTTLVDHAEAKLDQDFRAELAAKTRLKLITKRAVTTHNSWTHNLPEFVEGERDSNFLYMHPEDARAAGLTAGALADVSTDIATVRVPVRLTTDLSVGTVALPHGWGHQRSTGLRVASKTAGVNVNLLAADGPNRLERVSGMAHLTGLLVQVSPARGPRDTTSWSGIGAEPTAQDLSAER